MCLLLNKEIRPINAGTNIMILDVYKNREGNKGENIWPMIVLICPMVIVKNSFKLLHV